jgi:cytoskeletal protein CcmA (bactofilin family)
MHVQNNAEKPITPADAGVALQPKPAETWEATTKRDEAPAIPGAASDLLLGRGVRFEGKLTFAGTVRIDASFVGTIVTNDVLVVGEAARIDANISCGTIVVHGEVNGNIQAKTGVEIRGSAKVRGDLETPSLVIEKGAFFQGASRMESAAKAARPKTAA